MTMRKTLQLLPALALVVTAACGDDDGGFTFVVPDGGPPRDAGFDAGPARECTDESRGSTIGESCLRDVECDDGCFCNGFEVCRGGVCDVGQDPCDDGFDCTTDSCSEDDDACTNAPDDTVCDDGNLCNGTEVCDPEIGCAAGPPATCTDADPCTLDLCDDETGACTFPIRDLDGDGFAEGQRGCGGTDCDDNPLTGAAINPGVAEDCSNEIDDDCDLAIDLADDECAPTNVTCDAAEVIASSGDDLFWTSTGLLDNFDLDCDTTDNVYDAVFAFTLTEAADVVARVSGGGNDSAVAIRTAAACADDETDDLACDDGTTTTPAEVEIRNVPAGDYVLIASVETETFFNVTLEVGPPTLPPPSDACDPMVTPLIPNDATTTFSGTWESHEDDFAAPDCADISSGGVDVVHRISITEPKDVRLEAIGTTTTGSSTSTSLYVLTDCADLATVEYCSEGNTSDDPSVFARPLPAGDYYVVVEKAFSGSGNWELTATIEDPVPRVTADVCATAPDVTDTTSTIPIATLERDDGLGCDGDRAVWRDAYFLVSLTEAQDVTVETSADGLHLLSFADGACGDATAETLCRATPSTATEVFRNLAAGDYYVAVGTARTSGDIEVTTTLSDPTPPPSNDECSGARVIMGGAVVTASSVGATDTVSPSCGGTGSLDTWYEFTLTADSTVVITAEPASADDPDDVAIELRAGCDDAPLACDAGEAAGITRSLTAGTYRVAVESLGRGEREITLRLAVL